MTRTWRRLVWVLVVAITASSSSPAVQADLFEGEECVLNGAPGLCTSIHNCDEARAALKLGVKPTLCSYAKDLPIVCCRGLHPPHHQQEPDWPGQESAQGHHWPAPQHTQQPAPEQHYSEQQPAPQPEQEQHWQQPTPQPEQEQHWQQPTPQHEQEQHWQQPTQEQHWSGQHSTPQPEQEQHWQQPTSQPEQEQHWQQPTSQPEQEQHWQQPTQEHVPTQQPAHMSWGGQEPSQGPWSQQEEHTQGPWQTSKEPVQEHDQEHLPVEHQYQQETGEHTTQPPYLIHRLTTTRATQGTKKKRPEWWQIPKKTTTGF